MKKMAHQPDVLLADILGNGRSPSDIPWGRAFSMWPFGESAGLARKMQDTQIGPVVAVSVNLHGDCTLLCLHQELS